MSWLKDVILDILVTLVIVALVVTHHEVIYWVITAYTALMIVLKLLFMTNRSMLRQVDAPDRVPDMVYHVLYGANMVLLGIAAYWGLAAAWAVLWGLSTAAKER